MNKKKEGITVVSAFDGISCARVALKKNRIKVANYFASEIEAPAMQISQKNFPDVVQLGDIQDIFFYPQDWKKFPKVDLLVGGSPCQDLSIANTARKGLKGKRSGLFYEYVRLLKEMKPKYFILENVNSMSKEAKAVITKELGVEPIMIDASLVSAQNRKRLFWTNIPGVYLPIDREIYLKDIIEEKVDEKYYLSDKTLKTILDKMRQGKPIGQAFRIMGIDGKSVSLKSSAGGTGGKTGLYIVALTEARTEEARIARAKFFKETGKDFSPRRGKELMPRKDGKMNTLTTGITKESLILIVPEATKAGFAFAKDGYSVDFSYPTSKTRRGRVGRKAKNLMTSHNVSVFIEGRVRRLTPTECERLQGLPDGYTAGLSDNQAYKVLGNAFNADVMAHIMSFMPKKK